MTPEEQVQRAHDEIDRADEEIKRADEAKRILETPMVRDAFAVMEREVYEAWLATPARDGEAREWLWRQATALKKFQEMLRGTMESGRLAFQRKPALVERIRNAAKKVANWG
jgi:hypothetical protein